VHRRRAGRRGRAASSVTRPSPTSVRSDRQAACLRRLCAFAHAPCGPVADARAHARSPWARPAGASLRLGLAWGQVARCRALPLHPCGDQRGPGARRASDGGAGGRWAAGLDPLPALVIQRHALWSCIPATRILPAATSVPRSAPGGWSADGWASADELRLLRGDGTIRAALCYTGAERPCVARGPRVSARVLVSGYAVRRVDTFGG
jgi:hypothetical protein